MSGVDQRQKLSAAQPFSYKRAKGGKVFVYYESKMVKTLKGKQAEKLLAQVELAGPLDVQLALAKVTGNFKRGNERGRGGDDF